MFRARSLVAVFAFLVFVLAQSCANNDQGTPDGGGTDASVNPCGKGTAVKCGDTCVDTQSNAQNCGACSKACSSDQVCSHGTCAVVCGGGTSRCGNDCVDLNADVANCGGCNKPCPSGNVCNKATCALTCQTGLTDCNGDCVDTTQNDDNCGACGSPCAAGQVCSNSTCVATCEVGWSSCAVGDAGATTCADTLHDTSNCGTCGTTCPKGQFCSPKNGVGTCGIKCGGGTSLCTGKCVDENIDPGNCGGCGSVCGGTCSSGHCCAKGQAYCGACDTVANCITKSSGRISAGSGFTCAIASTGKLKCWGDDFYGQLGDNNPTTASNVPVTVLTLTNVTNVGLGYDFACAVAGGKAYCWGDPFGFELGDNDQNTELDQPGTALAITASTTATRIEAGTEQGCVILSNSTIECWGYNGAGEVGDGTETTVKKPKVIALGGTPIDVSAGIGDTTCALLSGGTVKCFGDDFAGQCGDNTSTFNNVDSPTTVVNLTGVASISVGQSHACALKSNGTIFCWGDDFYDQLGDGGNVNDQSVVPVQAQGVSNALAVAAGGSHTCALLQSGAVVCWGSNTSGQLGDGTGVDSATPVVALSSGAVAIAAGGDHTCALKSDGTAWCWGYNGDGELGDGTNNDSMSPVQVLGF